MNPGRQPLDLSLVVEHDRRLIVQQQAARVQIGRAAQCEAAVEHHRLRVIHAAQQMDRHAGTRQGAQCAMAHEVRQPMIGGGRNAQIDLHPASGGEPNRHLQAGVGYEVGSDREHALGRVEAGVDQQRAHGVFRLVRSARQKLRAAGGILCRGDGGARRGLAARRGPVRLELIRGRRRHRTLEIERQIGPRRDAGCAAEILGGEVPSSAPDELPVGNHPFAVVAQVPRALSPAREQRREHRDLRPGSAHPLEPGSRQPDGADAVDQKANPHAAFDAGEQMLGDLLAECVTSQYVGANVEAAIRPAHRLEQGAARLIAVLMHAHPRRCGGRQAEALDESLRPMLGGGGCRQARKDPSR